MKKIFLLIIAVFLIFFNFALANKNQLFYYHNNEKIYLDIIDNTKVIHFNKTIEIWKKDSICNYLKSIYNEIIAIDTFTCQISSNNPHFEKDSIIQSALKNGDIQYISNMLMYKNSTLQWASNEIFVKIHSPFDIHKVLFDNNIPVIAYRQFGSNEQTYIVELEVIENSAIEYANILVELDEVVCAEPSFWKLIKKHNPYYSSQWGLKNTGQYEGIPDVDIHVENAWNIATGAGIKVAVIDEGVDLTHPDLINNLLSGYDATDAYFGGSEGGYGGNGCDYEDAHGTACSGIIAAENNNIGVKGVAYNANIIPIRIGYSDHFFVGGYCWQLWTTNDSWIADGIFKAWHDYGADVLSNSWGGGSPSFEIDEEINAALTHGRDFLGCIVVFSTGNYNSEILYPANSNPAIIAVGAMSFCGERKSLSSCDDENWGSNYGEELDVVAPGVLIATTDIQGGEGYNPKLFQMIEECDTIPCDFLDQDYTMWFSGTSAACPHVSGIAALILSVNPTLTGQEVWDIIESTAQKVRTDLYTYDTVPNRPNGTWHEEMGYGLVDACEAVFKAFCKSNLPSLQQQIIKDTLWSTIEYIKDTIIIKKDVNLTISSLVKFTENAAIVVEPGGKLIIDGGTLTNACENQMWQGISVQSSGSYRKPSGVQGVVEVINGGTIENAKIGIHSTNGGFVTATDAVFRNNQMSIVIDSVINKLPVTITNSQFLIDDNYLGNINFFGPHIKLSSGFPIVVTDCSFSNENSDNAIYRLPSPLPYLNTGIWAFNTSLSVNESIFSKLGVAINSSNSGTSPLLQIDQCDFTDNVSSVVQNAINYSNITNNNFNLFTTKQSFGISIGQSMGYTITENIFVKSSSQPNSFQTSGIKINNSGLSENEIYKNYFFDLSVGIQALNKNSSQIDTIYTRISGLQFLCNYFSNIQQNDILVGNTAYQTDHSVRLIQGNSLDLAGNVFAGQVQRINLFNNSNFHVNYYYSNISANENPTTSGSVTKYPQNITSFCPSKTGKSRGNLENALAQYDEWNEQYEYYLALLKGTEEGSEEYYIILNKVSYYSALKDNYFNWIIASTMNEVSGMRYEVSGNEGVDGEAGRGSLYETLRFLFSYRNHYTDNLSIAETYMAEHNYDEAQATIAQIYAQFEITSEQVDELTGLQTYIRWLQQLENNQKSIYSLSENEIEYLVNYVETNIGRGRVFANNILCGLYGICKDEVGGERYEVSGGDEVSGERYAVSGDGKKSPSNFEGVDGAAGRGSLNDITLIPNPTTGKLRIENGELKIINVEVFDMYGRNLTPHTSYLTPLTSLDISDLTSGVYFVKITTEKGIITKKIIKI